MKYHYLMLTTVSIFYCTISLFKLVACCICVSISCVLWWYI